MSKEIVASTYAQYDQHYELIDPMIDIDADDYVVEGFAIRKEDRASFLFDLKHLISQYGVSYGELAEKDVDDSSLKMSLHVAKAQQDLEQIEISG